MTSKPTEIIITANHPESGDETFKLSKSQYGEVNTRCVESH